MFTDVLFLDRLYQAAPHTVSDATGIHGGQVDLRLLCDADAVPPHAVVLCQVRSLPVDAYQADAHSRGGHATRGVVGEMRQSPASPGLSQPARELRLADQQAPVRYHYLHFQRPGEWEVRHPSSSVGGAQNTPFQSPGSHLHCVRESPHEAGGDKCQKEIRWDAQPANGRSVQTLYCQPHARRDLLVSSQHGLPWTHLPLSAILQSSGKWCHTCPPCICGGEAPRPKRPGLAEDPLSQSDRAEEEELAAGTTGVCQHHHGGHTGFCRQSSQCLYSLFFHPHL